MSRASRGTMSAVAVAVLLGIVAGLAGALVLVYRRTARPGWETSELRLGALAFIAAVGPFFGVHIRPPKPEPPAVTTPRHDDDPEGAALAAAIEADRDRAERPPAPPPV